MPAKKKGSSALERKNESNILKIFNYVGSALIFFGIVYFINANWNAFNDFVKIGLTLGPAITAFIIAILLHRIHPFKSIESIFFVVAGFTLPIGFYVTLDVLHLSLPTDVPEIIVSFICLAIFLACQFILPRTIFLLFNILFASFLFIHVVNILSRETNYIFLHLFEYEIITLGFIYIALGYYLSLEKRFRLVGPLYFFGSLFVLSASYFLSSAFFFSNATMYWKIMTAIFIMLAFSLAVPLKSKSFLYFGAIFLILFVTDLSYQFAQQFGDLGWSLILIAVGILFILLGYVVIHVRKEMRLDKSEEKNQE